MTIRERVLAMSARTEFFLVLAVAFSYFVGTSLALLFSGQRTFDLTTGRAVRGIAAEVIILIVVGWVLITRGWNLGNLVGQFSWNALFAGIPLAVGYYVLYVLIVIAAVSAFGEGARSPGVAFKPLAPVALLVALVVLNSVFEELLVTGYIVSALTPRGAPLAIGGSVLVRFLYHLYHGPAAALFILPLGLVFAAVYWRWRTLWPLLLAHSVLNLLAFSATTSAT